MISDINFQAYEDVEQIQDFDSIQDIELYRNERLGMYEDHLSYVQSISDIRGKKLNIVDIGSGSSALLFKLANEKLINKGVGVEIAHSRYQFAEKWKSDLNNKSIHNINSNFEEVNLKECFYDIIFCIDNTFSYFHPEDNQYPSLFIKKAWQWLNKGGLLIFEMHNYKTIIEKMNDNILYFWKKNKTSNNFNYSLYKYNYDKNKNHITTYSKYLSKSIIKEKKEVSYVYDTKIINNLIDNKFKIDNIFSDFNLNQHNEKCSDDMVIICSKI